jgi:hypothetical protein
VAVTLGGALGSLGRYAVTAGEDPRLGSFAAAYVLFLAVLGPLLTRYAKTLAALFVHPVRH